MKNVTLFFFFLKASLTYFQKPESETGSASGSSIDVLDQNDIRDQPEGKFNKFLCFEYAEI